MPYRGGHDGYGDGCSGSPDGEGGGAGACRARRLRVQKEARRQRASRGLRSDSGQRRLTDTGPEHDGGGVAGCGRSFVMSANIGSLLHRVQSELAIECSSHGGNAPMSLGELSTLGRHPTNTPLAHPPLASCCLVRAAPERSSMLPSGPAAQQPELYKLCLRTAQTGAAQVGVRPRPQRSSPFSDAIRAGQPAPGASLASRGHQCRPIGTGMPPLTHDTAHERPKVGDPADICSFAPLL